MKLLFSQLIKHYQLALIVFAVIVITTTLGCWQISRAYEKSNIQEVYLKKSTGKAIQLDYLLDDTEKINNQQIKDINYQYVVSNGQFENGKHILLDNQVVNGKPGFNVITPFLTTTGRILLIDRGWLGPVIRRDQIPKIPEYNHQIKLSGLLFNKLSKPFLLAKEPLSNKWPKIVQSLDVVQLKKIFNLSEFYLLRLNQPQVGAFTPHFKAINISPEKHWGYAVQWFSMAIIILLLFFRFIYKSKKVEVKELHT